MALKFYLYSIDNQHEIHCDTNSTFTEIAGVFDLGSMLLEWNECKHAIFPNTPFFIVDTETNEKWSFIINQDNVEVVRKTSPVKYLHTLTLSQSIHKINNVPVRNSNFQQPLSYQKKIRKRTFFAGLCDGGTTSRYCLPNMELDYVNNSSNYVKANYTNDLRERGLKVTSAVINTKAVITTFRDVVQKDEPITPGNPYGHYIEVKTWQNKYLNNNVSSVTFEIVNADNENDKLTITLNSNQLYKDYFLPSNQASWLSGKRFYIRLIVGTLTRMDGGIPDTQSSGQAVQVGGYFTIDLTINTYRYTLWDVLDTLNKQCKKEYNGSSYSDFYTMPDKTTGQGLELDSIIAPEFNFNGMDLYECVAKVMSFIDAFPVLDENGILGFQYLNDLSEDVIEDLEMSDVKTTLNEENFTNKLATTYQNGKLNRSITYPSKSLFIHPATSGYGVPNRNDWYFFVSKPIDYIDKFSVILHGNLDQTCGIEVHQRFNTLGGQQSQQDRYEFKVLLVGERSIYADATDPVEIDLTSQTFSQELYNTLPDGHTYDSTQNINNTLYYEKGSNRIYLGRTEDIDGVGYQEEVFWFALYRAMNKDYGGGVQMPILNVEQQSPDPKYTYYFRCEYHPIVDGKVSQESISNKVEKETMVAQANSGVELNRLGNNLQGLIAKLGNEEKSVTLPITKMKDRVKLGTHYIDELGNNWIVNRIKTTFTTREDKVICEATFTKNFNAMQQFTSLNQEKRFYDISERITSKGYENINEFIYFTSHLDINVSSLSEKVAFTTTAILSILGKTFNISYPTFDDYNSVFDNVALSGSSKQTYIVPIVYGCGNQICFEMGYENAIEAQRRYNGSITETYPYTADDGVEDTFTIIGKFEPINELHHPDYYPQVELHIFDGVDCLKINGLKYYKKPSEIFHLNYAINFLPYWTKTTDELGTPQYKYEEIFFGDKFINENSIIPNNAYENGRPSLHIYLTNTKFSIVDNKIPSDAVDGGVQNIYLTTNIDEETTVDQAISGEIRVGDNAYNVSAYKSWCIADEEGNVYIAVNRDSNSSNYARLKFFTSRFRKV